MNYAIFSKGKITYWVKGQRFFNTTKNSRDGYEKACSYCADNFISTQEIIKFDSMTECDRYEFLLEEQKEGRIKNLQVHFPIKIQDSYINANGDEIPPMIYNADFVYEDIVSGLKIVEDVKGYSVFTDTRFEVIKQLFDLKYLSKKCYIKVVLKDKNGWYEFKLGQNKHRNAPRNARNVLRDKIIIEKEIERNKGVYVRLKDKAKLTPLQQEKFSAAKKYLTEKGIII